MKILEDKGFKKEDNKYGSGEEYMNGNLYSQGTIGVHIDGDNVRITKYHFQGEHSHGNSSGLFSGKITDENEWKTILKMIGI